MRLAISVSSALPSTRRWTLASASVMGSIAGPLVRTRAIWGSFGTGQWAVGSRQWAVAVGLASW